MAQQIKQANIFGRIGTGLGRGLAEQLPKEVERNRLASGLERLGEQKGLTPFQQFTGLVGAAHEYPQVVQSGERLLAQQAQANAYGNTYKSYLEGQGQNPQASADVTPGQERQLLDNMTRGSPQTQQGIGAPQQQGSPGAQGQRTQRVPPQEQPVANPNENTLNPAAKTRLPWTPERKTAAIVKYMKNGHLPPQAEQLAATEEAVDLGTATALQKRKAEDVEDTKNSLSELDRQLSLKLQKTGDARLADLPGEMQANIEKGMLKEQRNNPKLSMEDAADKWSNKALETAKARSAFTKLSQTTGPEDLFKEDKAINKLNDYAKIFKESGNSEEYYNLLKKSRKDGGFGFSSEGAASVAFPMSSGLNKYVSNYAPHRHKHKSFEGLTDIKSIESSSRNAAKEVLDLMGEDDSLLTIAKNLRNKDPQFNQKAFFDYINDNLETSRLNARQLREIPERNTDILPTWADFMYIPSKR